MAGVWSSVFTVLCNGILMMHCGLSDELQTCCRWEPGDGVLKPCFHSLVYIL